MAGKISSVPLTAPSSFFVLSNAEVYSQARGRRPHFTRHISSSKGVRGRRVEGHVRHHGRVHRYLELLPTSNTCVISRTTLHPRRV